MVVLDSVNDVEMKSGDPANILFKDDIPSLSQGVDASIVDEIVRQVWARMRTPTWKPQASLQVLSVRSKVGD